MLIEKGLSLLCFRRCNGKHGFRANGSERHHSWGTITDSTGAILPNVKIAVTNTATSATTNTVTSPAGDFSAPARCPLVAYTVSAQIAGFKKSVTKAFTLTVDQRVRVDVALKPGAVSETLEVTAQAVSLDTDTALSQLVSQQQVEELPLTGATSCNSFSWARARSRWVASRAPCVKGKAMESASNGGRPEGNNYTLDGLVEYRSPRWSHRRSCSRRTLSRSSRFQRHLFCRLRIQRHPDQHRQQGRHQQPARCGVLVRPQ